MTQSTDIDESRVILLTRTACHLCEPARAVVREVCEARGVLWREVNVDSDAELRAEYGDQVPVVLVDGAQLGEYGVDPDELSAALEYGA